MPMLIIGGEGKGEKARRPLSRIGGNGYDDEPTQGEESTDSPMDAEEQKLAAAEEIIAAIASRKPKRLKAALEAFCLACAGEEE